MTKLRALTVVCFGVVACSGGSGPRQPKMAVVPQGSGWHCEVGTPANACYRDQTVCNVAVFKARGAEGSPCNAAATATCVTYTQKGVDKADCLAETALCNKYRLWLADKDPEVASTISVCKVMP